MKWYISLPFLVSIAIFSFCGYMAFTQPKIVNVYPVEKLTRGRASKTEFSGHSYVIWQQNFSDCIVHDPDCKCRNKEQK